MKKNISNRTGSFLKKDILYYLWIAVFLSHFFSGVNIGPFAIDKITFLCFLGVGALLKYKNIIQTVTKTPFNYFGIFVLLTFVVNVYRGGIDMDYISKSFYFFGIYVFSVLSYNLINEDFSKYIKGIVLPSLIGIGISFLWIIFIENQLNPEAFFGNPNELSRVGLMFTVIASLLFFHKKWPLSEWYYYASVGASFMLAFAGIRRAALLGFLILFALLLLRSYRSLLYVSLFSLLGILLFYSFNNTYNLESHTDRVETRFVKEDGEEDSVLGRGYKRIINHPEYLILGAGEGGNDRFEKIWGYSYAIHATYPNILFSYGFVGLLLVLFYHRYFFSFVSPDFLLIIPLIAHSVFHNDIRVIYILVLPFIYHYLNEGKFKKLI